MSKNHPNDTDDRQPNSGEVDADSLNLEVDPIDANASGTIPSSEAPEISDDAADAADADRQGPTPTTIDIHSMVNQYETQVRQHQESAASEREKALRAMAEMENFKRRKEAEKLEFIKYANENVIRELLPVIDNLDRALDQSATATDVASILSGMVLIHKQLTGVLEKVGVTKMEALDQPFDPNRHQAVLQEDSEGPPDRVIKEMQAGYTYHDKVIRPAMVVVSK